MLLSTPEGCLLKHAHGPEEQKVTAHPSLARVAFLGGHVFRQNGIVTLTHDACEAVAAVSKPREITTETA